MLLFIPLMLDHLVLPRVLSTV